jgi:hypothetical protein
VPAIIARYGGKLAPRLAAREILAEVRYLLNNVVPH